MEVRVTKFFCKNRNGRYEIENERERRRVNGVCGHCHRVLINTFEFHHRQISFGRSFDDEFLERSTWWSVLLLLLLLMTDYWLLLILFAFSFLDNKKKKKKRGERKKETYRIFANYEQRSLKRCHKFPSNPSNFYVHLERYSSLRA